MRDVHCFGNIGELEVEVIVEWRQQKVLSGYHMVIWPTKLPPVGVPYRAVYTADNDPKVDSYSHVNPDINYFVEKCKTLGLTLRYDLFFEMIVALKERYMKERK